MTNLNRFSSRRHRLDHVFLRDKLSRARTYKRIAGYFRSSIFELIDEEVEAVDEIRIVCNSDLDPADIKISQLARETALKERWNRVPVELESLHHRSGYRKLYALLSTGKLKVRVVPNNELFVHGKAGVLELRDGSKTSFIGSINETRSAFDRNYEILWEDTSEEGIRWVEDEFDALWASGYDLPDAIIEEVKRVAARVEITFADVKPEDLPGAALAEAPLYRGGEQLQPWQRSFLTLFLRHRELYGRARILLADEVGLGKTLSLGGAAMLAALLEDGPVLILCPSTLTSQWQVELKDKLGIPSAVWHSTRKQWIDPDGHAIRTRGPEDIIYCPYRIAIVSTGLIFHDSVERRELLTQRYGAVVLDEAHKARHRGGLDAQKGTPNNLLDFMFKIGHRAKHILLGTATPIQTEVDELWDLAKILDGGAEFVLGRPSVSLWHDCELSLPYVKGTQIPQDDREAWELLRNPIPPAEENGLFADLRSAAGVARTNFFTDKPVTKLDYLARQDLKVALDPGFFQLHNPIVRHTVLRRRSTLEEKGLLEKVGVRIHPDPNAGPIGYPGLNLRGVGLITNQPFDLAYKAAEDFTDAMRKRSRAAGFMKSLLLQRICSSFASGIATAQKLLNRDLLDDEEEAEEVRELSKELSEAEVGYLESIIAELARSEARDPKLAAVQYFLDKHRTQDGKTWLEHGCIIFSQYYDTASWIAAELAKAFPNETVAVYAGVGKSGIFRDAQFNSVEREPIKAAVRAHDIRLLVATDAACEGLNLQTLGTLINVDLPWNPSRLEQRLGRIKRYGQVRRTVDMLNLVYHQTRDEDVYSVLSRRLRDQYDIFGGLPDTIDDDWIDNIQEMDRRIDQYIHLRDEARRNVFDIRYESTVEPDANRWETCERVLSRQDIIERLSEPW